MAKNNISSRGGAPRISSVLAAVVLLVLTIAAPGCRAFSPASHQLSPHRALQEHQQSPSTATALQMGLFGRDGMLGNLMGSGGSGGPKTVVELPAKDVKIGALRFLLNIVLVGEQNKPQPKSWFTKQGDEAGDLQVYYHDGTGMLSIELQEYGIKMTRHGEKPSLQYQLQESVLLHSVLDELATVAFGVEEDGIETEKRLLVLQDEDAIDKAREKLPARQA